MNLVPEAAVLHLRARETRFFSNWAYKVNKIEHVFREKNAKNPKIDKIAKIRSKSPRCP